MESALGFVSAETKPVWVKRRDRFRRYLLAHTLNNDDALMGIAVAKRQGIANHRDCAALIKTCRSKCSTNEPNPCLERCDDNIEAARPCQLMVRCLGPDNLPF